MSWQVGRFCQNWGQGVLADPNSATTIMFESQQQPRYVRVPVRL